MCISTRSWHVCVFVDLTPQTAPHTGKWPSLLLTAAQRHRRSEFCPWLAETQSPREMRWSRYNTHTHTQTWTRQRDLSLDKTDGKNSCQHRNAVFSEGGYITTCILLNKKLFFLKPWSFRRKRGHRTVLLGSLSIMFWILRPRYT